MTRRYLAGSIFSKPAMMAAVDAAKKRDHVWSPERKHRAGPGGPAFDIEPMSPAHPPSVCLWHLADIRAAPTSVRFRVQSGHRFEASFCNLHGGRHLPRVQRAMSGHPRNLPHADSKAVTPISPAAQKFHLFILCNALDNSVTLSNSSMPDLMLGNRHIADVNQNIAEPHAVIIAPVSMKDLIITPPNGSGRIACPSLACRAAMSDWLSASGR